MRAVVIRLNDKAGLKDDTGLKDDSGLMDEAGLMEEASFSFFKTRVIFLLIIAQRANR